jgi:hypothetical protein
MNWTWIITGLSIIGVVANIYKKRWCFYVWTFTNTTWFLRNLYIEEYPQAALFYVYIVLAVWGIISWRKK